MTFHEICDAMIFDGVPKDNATIIIKNVADKIESETSIRPNYDEEAPEWVVRNCIN